jgi:ABC-type uncharacterized transport system ATPase subunit
MTSDNNLLKTLADFGGVELDFNRNFQFYGRKIELVRYDGRGLLLSEFLGAGELSTGTRRTVGLGCVLAQEAAVVLLDEPSAAVSQGEGAALATLLRRVRAETGCSMVIIEHDMALLSSLCDGFVALEQGAVIARGAPSRVLSDSARETPPRRR